MDRKHFQISLALVTSFFILVFPAYLRFADLADDNLFSSDLSFENPDGENLLIDHQNGPKVFVSSIFFSTIFLEINLFGHIPRFPSLTVPFDQKAFVLRC